MCMIRRLFAMAWLALLCLAPAMAQPTQAKDQPPASAPTFRVYATREGLVGHRTANGHRIQPRDRFVALPSWRVLSSLGGHEFQVRVTYGDRSVVLPVWDVGPWNTDDDYWSPSRRYADLPQGRPMAQAAYQDGYNGGRDASGRRVLAPNGIDIADGAFWDDLGMVGSDWVEVTFLWLGVDAGPQLASDTAAQPAEQVALAPGALAVDDGGSGYHGEAAIKWYDAGCGLQGRHSWTYGTPDPALGENRATWTPELPGPGFYEVQAYIPACGRPATRAASYRITHDGATTERLVDQAASAGSWVSLGTYHLGDGPAQVTLSDITGDDGLAVRFDAVQWLPRTDSAPPDARVLAVLPQPDGSLLAQWGGSDDTSGLAAYDVQVRMLPSGGWSDWQVATTVSQATFVPPGPGAYGFRARGRDWAGNLQPWREADDVVAGAGG